MSNSKRIFGVLICFSLLSTGCKKEIAAECEENIHSLRAATTRPFRMSAETWYRISPTAPTPVPGMPGQLSFANVPGGGSGHATHMGNVSTWFNQLAYSPDGQNPPAGSLSAPVAAALTYPVLFPGAPLPLIQPNDFTAFAIANAWLQVPTTVNGRVVWSIIQNDRGDAVFFSTTSPSAAVVESPTRVSFGGDGIIVGGRGRFEHATGTYRFSGFFNPQDSNDAGYEVDGLITY